MSAEIIETNKNKKIVRRVYKNCLECGAEFSVKKSAEQKSFYCSKECVASHLSKKMAGEGNFRYKNWITESKIEKTCQHCGSIFLVNHYRDSTAIACSRSCANTIKARARMKFVSKKQTKERIISGPYTRLHATKLCGHLTKNKGRKYCDKCSPNKGNALVRSNCASCGIEFKSYKRSNGKPNITCSPECASKHKSDRQKGIKSHLWKGGLTNSNLLIRGSYEYGNWRKSVFERDDYTCQMCGTRGRDLTADHILPFSLYPLLRLEPSNGRTLCKSCHGKLPTTGANIVNFMVKQKKKLGGIQLGLI